MRIENIEVHYDGLNPRVELSDGVDRRILVRTPEAVLALAAVLQRYGEHMVDEERRQKERLR